MKLGGDKRIDRCLHLLKRHSESNGGTVTYHVVVDVIEKTGCESTLDVLEFIYDQLVAEGIRIAAELFTESHDMQGPTYDAGVSGGLSTLDGEGEIFEVETHHVRSVEKKFSCNWSSLEPKHESEKADCLPAGDTLYLEELIDEFLSCAEGTEVSWSLFMRLIAKHCLKITEALEVVEYLKSLGFELEEVELYLEGLFSAANGWKHNYYSIYDGETTRPTAQGGSYDRFLVKLLEKCRSGIPIRGWRLS